MTTLPEEAVNAMPERIYAVKQREGSNCVVSFNTPSLDYNVEYVRADLAAPHLAAVRVKVKALDWQEDSAPGYRLFSAQSDIGHFAYGTDADGNPWSSSPLGIKDHANEEAAKRAAEKAHYGLVVDQAKAIGLEVSALEPSAGDCECTKTQQDETCPVGYPSLLCEICDGKGVVQPSAARELALEEILREVDEIERKVWAWSGSAFLNNELEGAEDADCKTELYSELCGIGNTMHWLRTKICALSSPDHADAGKVEGNGWAVSTPKFHRYPYFVENIGGKWCLCKHHGNGASHTISVHETASEARSAAPSQEVAGS